ncbi:MAG TPA: BrnA antitoxin family protein [Thermomicrobiales bacterium]|nr:BrnA antitoxin family protein [Thermomicrobiales bacterium]
MAKREQIVSYTAEEIDEMIARGEDQTDWERVRTMTDEEAEAAIDHEEEGEFDWNAAYVGSAPAKQQITVRFDTDIIEWFKENGPGYQTRMNQVLRAYIEAQRNKKAS